VRKARWPSAAHRIARLAVVEFRASRTVWFVVASIVTARLIAEFAAAIAITDTSDMMRIVYAGLVRPLVVAFTAAHVAFVVLEDFERRLFEFTIARGVSRTAWLVGRLAGSAAVAVACAAVAGLVALTAGSPVGATLVWSFGLAAEAFLAAQFALTAVVTLREGAVALVAAAGFYLVSRTATTIARIASADTGPQDTGVQVVRALARGIEHVTPDLERFAPAAGLVDRALAPHVVALETLVFAVLLASAALFDLHRRVH